MILRDGDQLIHLDNKFIDLCQVFQEIAKDDLPMNQLVHFLSKSPYKRIKNDVVQLLAKHVDLSGDTMSEQTIHGLANTKSDLFQNLYAECGEDVHMKACLDYIHMKIDTIFNGVVNRVTMVKGRTLAQVCDFLQIPCAVRGQDMFSSLPHVMQGIGPGVDLKTVVDPSLHPYIDFVNGLDEQSLLELARASHVLGIPTLTTLVGCRMARLLTELPEQVFRNKFNIPAKYMDPTLQRLRQIRSEKPWLSVAAPLQ
jgi:hypothetical protein